MSIILVFMTLIAGIAGWWLSRQRLMAKPWLEANCDGDFIPAEQSAMPAAKIGLGVFLAVVGALFSLLMSAYIMRMGVTDSLEERGVLPLRRMPRQAVHDNA